MKRLSILLILSLIFSFQIALAQETEGEREQVAPEVTFTPEGNGTYIYANNNESILRWQLSDISNPTPQYLMNNPDQKPGKYSMFVSYLNHTDKEDEQGNIIEPGFDIEVDVEFKAKEDTTVRFTALGFDAPAAKTLFNGGAIEKFEDSWACLDAWATYLKMPIYQRNSYRVYENKPFQEKTVEIKEGTSFWISEIIDNYSELPYLRPMHLLSDFEILSGQVDINVAALKYEGILKDRSHHAQNAAIGTYYRDRQYKGVADTLPQMNTALSFDIDDSMESGTKLPVVIRNQYYPDGRETTYWMTHINPQEDRWCRETAVQSDMLELRYYDGEKLKYYGENVPQEERDPYWRFDVYHSDTLEYDPELMGDVAPEDYRPNYPLSVEEDNVGKACNLGNYGVTLRYTISVTNHGEKDRYLNYNMKTTANDLFILRDVEGKPVQPYVLGKGSNWNDTEDTMASVLVPAGETTTFIADVILPTNSLGGTGNSLMITDEQVEVPVKLEGFQLIEKNSKYTGREYLSWVDGKLYISQDNENWTEKPVSQELSELIEYNWDNYEFIYGDNGTYMMKWASYDGAPSYFTEVLDYFKTVYLLSEDLNILQSYTFANYPISMSYSQGKYYVRTNANFFTYDFIHWYDYREPILPLYNQSGLSAIIKQGEIYVSVNGLDYARVRYPGEVPLYIDVVGDVYYYNIDNTVYLSKDAVYWYPVELKEPIRSIEKRKGAVLINGETLVDTTKLDQNLFIKYNRNILQLSAAPIWSEEGSILVPIDSVLSFIAPEAEWNETSLILSSEKLDKKIQFKAESATALVNGRAIDMKAKGIWQDGHFYVPVRFLAEELDYNVEWEDPVVSILNKTIFDW